MVGLDFIESCINEDGSIDYKVILKRIEKLKGIDWLIDGFLKYIKGILGFKVFVEDFIDWMLV